MQILFVGAEAAPIAKVGGMGDVIGALPKFLRKLGHDVRVFMPYYGTLDARLDIPKQPIWEGDAMFQSFQVYQTELPETDVPLYLMGHEIFAGKQIYGGADEAWRFTFFANGAAEFAWNGWKPDVIHCHDWHAGMIPVWMSQSPDISTVFTIHNLAYQGPSRPQLEQMTWCPSYMEGHNTLAAAVQFADAVTTVSPTYAEQIQTPEYGETVEGLLSFISGKLHGILNGIDRDVFDPERDRYLVQNYNTDTLEKRSINKRALQREVGLEENPDRFFMGIVSRLVEQKGLDLIIQTMDRFLAYTDAQLIVLGTGSRYYETELWQLASRYPGRVAVQLMYSEISARRIYAGIDAFLMPSRFEPCGISQMIAMRYGAIPIVRRTGGLVDTVLHHEPAHHEGTGYCFDRYEPLDFFTCMVRAWEGFRYKEAWAALQRRAMQQNFGWDISAQAYATLYETIVASQPASTLVNGAT